MRLWLPVVAYVLAEILRCGRTYPKWGGGTDLTFPILKVYIREEVWWLNRFLLDVFD